MGVTGSVPAYLTAARELDPERVMGRLIGDAANRRWVSQAGDEVPGPVWLAEFTSSEGSALHCAEISPAFGVTPDAGETPVRQLFLDFVRGRSPGWPEYDQASGRQVSALPRSSPLR